MGVGARAVVVELAIVKLDVMTMDVAKTAVSMGSSYFLFTPMHIDRHPSNGWERVCCQVCCWTFPTGG